MEKLQGSKKEKRKKSEPSNQNWFLLIGEQFDGYVKTPQRTLLFLSSHFQNHLPALLQPLHYRPLPQLPLPLPLPPATIIDRQQHRCGSMPCPQRWSGTKLLPLSFLPHPLLQLLFSCLHLQDCSYHLSIYFLLPIPRFNTTLKVCFFLQFILLVYIKSACVLLVFY